MVATIDDAILVRLRESAVVRAIGRTPLLPLKRFARHYGIPDEIEIWLKAEWTNPGGSVKDRPALSMVRDALERGELGHGRVLLDSTSGNTGIAYAMLGAALDFQVELVMPANASEERKQILRSYGATVTLSDPFDGSNGAIKLATQIAAEKPLTHYFCDQYGNPANPAAHKASTGPEIWEQTSGRVTHFVACLGTTGTMMGTGSYLKERNPAVSLVAVQPAEAFHGIEGTKHMPTSIVPPLHDEALPDVQVGVQTEEAFDTAHLAARVE